MGKYVLFYFINDEKVCEVCLGDNITERLEDRKKCFKDAKAYGPFDTLLIHD